MAKYRRRNTIAYSTYGSVAYAPTYDGSAVRAPRREEELYRALMDSEGSDRVIIYVRKENQKKTLPENRNVQADQELLERLQGTFGEKNVKAVKKYIENTSKMN